MNTLPIKYNYYSIGNYKFLQNNKKGDISMKSFKSVLFSILIISLAMFGVTGCSSGENDTEVVTLKFWDFHTEDEEDYFLALVDEYNESQEEVVVEYTTFNQSDYSNTTIPVAFAGGEGPDIFMTSPGDFQKYVDNDVLANLSTSIDEEVKDDFLPSALEQVTIGGEILAIPFELEPLGLYYDKDIFEENSIKPPTTWDELLEVADQLTTDEMSGIALPHDKSPYFNFIWYPFLWQNGGGVLNEEGTESIFNTPETAEALDMWGTMFQEGYAPSKLQYGPAEIDNIGEGDTAMLIAGSWAIPRAEKEFSDTNFGVVSIPAPDDGKFITAAGGWKLAVNKNSDYVEEASDFAVWAFGSKDITHTKEFVTEVKFAYPARQSVINEAEEFYDKGLRKVFTEEIFDTARPEPKYGPEIIDAVGEAMQEVMTGEATGEEAASAAHDKIQNILNSEE